MRIMEQEEIKMAEETKKNLDDEEIEENEDVEDQDDNKRKMKFRS